MVVRELVVAVFEGQAPAEDAVRRLVSRGTQLDRISIFGNGYRTEDGATRSCHAGASFKLWGQPGAAWGAIWGLLLGATLMALPFGSPVVVLGHFAMMGVGAIVGALLFGRLSAAGGVLVRLGIPKEQVGEYEAAVKFTRSLVIVRGTEHEVAHAKRVLAESETRRLDHYPAVYVVAGADLPRIGRRVAAG